MIPFIIAEIGINHNGNIENAKKLIKMAKDAGCDAVKFQKRNIDVVYTREFLDSPRESPWGTTQRAQKEGLEFGLEEYGEIDKYCKKLKIEWFASAWDMLSQCFLLEFKCKYNKIASPMLTHFPFVRMVAVERKHTFISTGMSSWEEIDNAVKIFKKYNCPFTLMHCVSVYPCDDEYCNISVIPELKKRYQCPVGYSGHEVGLVPTILAVALGAVAIERHITLDRASYGSDQSASLEKAGLERVVRDTRLVGKILGNWQKTILPEEKKNAEKLRYWK